MDTAPSHPPPPRPSPESGEPTTHDLHLSQLRPFHQALIASLAAGGLGGSELVQILDREVEASCVQCGLRVTGGEISAALAAEDTHTAVSPKHARLLQHYCARNGCPSYFYRFSFPPHRGIDWARLLGEVQQRLSQRTAAVSADDLERRRSLRRAALRRTGRILAVVLALATLWTLRHWWRTGSLPGGSKPGKYQVDPASLPPAPHRPSP